ncbi:hypothetical protein V1520DRAFT_358150, partial [Lipomyces starkeyi]
EFGGLPISLLESSTETLEPGHSSYFPNIKTVQTSPKFYGQIYIPIANWRRRARRHEGSRRIFRQSGDKVPTVYAQFLQKFEMQQKYVVFFHLRPLPLPTVPEEERYNIRRTKIPKTFRITLRHG